MKRGRVPEDPSGVGRRPRLRLRRLHCRRDVGGRGWGHSDRTPWRPRREGDL